MLEEDDQSPQYTRRPAIRRCTAIGLYLSQQENAASHRLDYDMLPGRISRAAEA